MKKIAVIIILLVVSLLTSSPVIAQQNLSERLLGSWQGTGTLMGSEATFDMRWTKELDSQFLKLTFQNVRSREGKQPVQFNATAMYRPTAEGWEGTWFDVRGISFPLKGTVEGDTLIVDWGDSEIEKGRTVYALQNDSTMHVTDYILKDDKYNKFGEAVYKRVSKRPESKAGKAIGIGGIFFKSENPEATRNWYRKHLGLMSNERGGSFVWRKFDNPEAFGFTVWHAFNEEDPYFNLSESNFMVNYRVNNLDLLLDNLRSSGVNIVGGIEEYEFGRFAWVLDPDGHKVELWEPKDVEYLKMLDHEGNQLYNTSN